MADDDYPTPEQWAELRKTGSVCGTCQVRVWPAPARGLTESDRDRVLAIVDEMEDQGVDFLWVTQLREIALGGQTFESWQEARRAPPLPLTGMTAD